MPVSVSLVFCCPHTFLTPGKFGGLLTQYLAALNGSLIEVDGDHFQYFDTFNRKHTDLCFKT